MPELVVDFDPTVCLVCHSPAEYQCPCGRSYCGELLAVLIGAGADECDCGRAW